jgi:hypothetical protein
MPVVFDQRHLRPLPEPELIRELTRYTQPEPELSPDAGVVLEGTGRCRPAPTAASKPYRIPQTPSTAARRPDRTALTNSW